VLAAISKRADVSGLQDRQGPLRGHRAFVIPEGLSLFETVVEELSG
jgi:hypothetical protein